MKIGFWSNARNCGTTTAAIACAIADIGIYHRNVALLQTPFRNNMEYPLTGEKLDGEAFSDVGIDALIRDYRSQPITEEIFLSDGISLIGKKMNYFTGTRKQNREKYEADMDQAFCPIVNLVQKYTDDIFIDFGNEDGEYVRKAIQSMDAMVVCLPQNSYYLDHFFEGCFLTGSYEREEALKAVYAIMRYNRDSRHSIRNIRRKYRIRKSPVVGMGECANLMDAGNEGRVLQYVLRVLEPEKGSASGAYINGVSQIMEHIIEGR